MLVHITHSAMQVLMRSVSIIKLTLALSFLLLAFMNFLFESAFK